MPPPTPTPTLSLPSIQTGLVPLPASATAFREHGEVQLHYTRTSPFDPSKRTVLLLHSEVFSTAVDWRYVFVPPSPFDRPASDGASSPSSQAGRRDRSSSRGGPSQPAPAAAAPSPGSSVGPSLPRQKLSDSFNLLAFDMRGHGRTRETAVRKEWDQQCAAVDVADGLAALCDRQDSGDESTADDGADGWAHAWSALKGRLHLLGHMQGSLIALRLAVMHKMKEMVESVTIAGPLPEVETDAIIESWEGLEALWAEVHAAAHQSGVPDTRLELSPDFFEGARMYHLTEHPYPAPTGSAPIPPRYDHGKLPEQWGEGWGPLPELDYSWASRFVWPVDPTALFWIQEPWVRRMPLDRDALSSLHVPVLIIEGEAGVSEGPWADALADLVPNAAACEIYSIPEASLLPLALADGKAESIAASFISRVALARDSGDDSLAIIPPEDEPNGQSDSLSSGMSLLSLHQSAVRSILASGTRRRGSIATRRRGSSDHSGSSPRSPDITSPPESNASESGSLGVPGTSGGNRDMHRARDSQIYKQIVRGRSASGADNSGPLGSLGEDMGDGDESVRENCKNEHERGHGHGHKREQEQERGLKINQQKCGQGQQQGDDADAEEDEDATLTVSSASTANRDPRSRPDPVRVYSSVSAGTPSPLLDQINIHVETEEHEEI